MNRARALLATAVLSSQGCSGSDDELSAFAQRENAVQIILGGSGVYMGDGLALTNWHVCSADDHVQLYNDPGTPSARYREGAALDDGCNDVPWKESCEPLKQVVFESWRDEPSSIASVVFASKTVDVCILQLTQDEVPADLVPLEIETAPVRLGQEVVVAGYRLGEASKFVERCSVTEETRSVRDPDQVHPSDSEVMSFAIDCKTPQHGSSGAPVFDASTGALLGLLWTGDCAELGKCRGAFYVSAASHWRAAHQSRPPEQYSRLDALLREFGGM